MTSIGAHAFSGCTSLASITIPDSVTSIGKDAFWYCTSLVSITIPDSVSSIGNYAFWGCTSLASITIPGSVKWVGSRVFHGCTALNEIINLSTASLLKDNVLESYEMVLKVKISPYEPILKMDARYKPFAVELYLKQADQYPEERKAEYLKYIKSQNAKLLLSFISEKKAESVLALLNTKLVLPSSIEKGIRAATGNAEITAILLDYQEKHVDLQKEREKERKKLYAALTHVETDTEQLKKKFNCKKPEDGTLTVTNYKGNELKVTVPEKIGKSTVTAIEAYAFSPFAPRCKNQVEREHITEIVLA